MQNTSVAVLQRPTKRYTMLHDRQFVSQTPDHSLWFSAILQVFWNTAVPAGANVVIDFPFSFFPPADVERTCAVKIQGVVKKVFVCPIGNSNSLPVH